MFSIDDEAGDSPKTNRGATGREGLVVAAFVDARKVFAETVLTPANGLTVRVDEDPVRASLLDEVSFFPADFAGHAQRANATIDLLAVSTAGESACTDNGPSHFFERKVSQNRARSFLIAPSWRMSRLVMAYTQASTAIIFD